MYNINILYCPYQKIKLKRFPQVGPNSNELSIQFQSSSLSNQLEQEEHAFPLAVDLAQRKDTPKGISSPEMPTNSKATSRRNSAMNCG